MKTNKFVYVITSGDYSDYRINAVFSTKKLADEYARCKNLRSPWWSDTRVEKWELDSAKIEQVTLFPDGHKAYQLTFYDNETEAGPADWVCDELQDKVMESLDKECLEGFINKDDNSYHICVVAESREQAIRVAVDRMAKAWAEKEGIS